MSVVFTCGENSCTLPQPMFGYKSRIILPYQRTENDKGDFPVYDPGETYDTRECEMTFELSASDQNNFEEFFNNICRSDNSTTMTVENGFYPFAPDKTGAGVYTVAIYPHSVLGCGDEPFKYFHNVVRVQNIGSYPTYVLPSEISEGSMTIGTVSNLRFPPSWMNTDNIYQFDVQGGYAGGASFLNRGTYGDSFNASCTMFCNLSKSAALLKYITGSLRTGAAAMTFPDNSYPFGRAKGNTASVIINQDIIEVTAVRHNLFTFPLKLHWNATLD